MSYMITQQTTKDIESWFQGRLPESWTAERPGRVSTDRDEIIVIVSVAPPAMEDDAIESARAAAADGRAAAWRDETRDGRIAIAREAERRFGRKVSWGVEVGGSTTMFTHISVPTMTRLRQPERLVLDTLVEAGVARSRSDALQWCVRLVARHSEEWLGDLRSAMEQVHSVREQGPAA